MDSSSIDSGSGDSSSEESGSEDELPGAINDLLKLCKIIVDAKYTRHCISTMFYKYAEHSSYNVISQDCLRAYNEGMRSKLVDVEVEDTKQNKKTLREWFESEVVSIGDVKCSSKICISTIYYDMNKQCRESLLECYLVVVFYAMNPRNEQDKKEMERLADICVLDMPEENYREEKEQLLEAVGFGFKSIEGDVKLVVDKMKLPPPEGTTYGVKAQKVYEDKIHQWEQGAAMLKDIK